MLFLLLLAIFVLTDRLEVYSDPSGILAVFAGLELAIELNMLSKYLGL